VFDDDWSLTLAFLSLLTLLQSELRVRHRDECKNVTRLTMENVSTASELLLTHAPAELFRLIHFMTLYSWQN